MNAKAYRVAILSAVFCAGTSCLAAEYYVDAEYGSNGNSGLAGSAKKTLKAVFEDCRPEAGDIVHAAPGVYSNDVMTTTAGYRGNYRAVVPAGVTLIADEGAEVTAIEGAPDTVNGTAETYWCGSDAVRCVQLGSGGILRGFTLRNGYASGWTDKIYVGAVDALKDTGSYIVDCVISNCYAGRAAGLNGGTAIRCKFNDNRVSTTGCDMMDGSAYNCWFGNVQNTSHYNIYKGGPYVNNVFYGTGKAANFTGTTTLYNCIVLKEVVNHVVYSNCAVTASSGTLGGGSEHYTTLASMKLDENYRPLRGSPLIDAGCNDFYDTFPSAMADEKSIDYLKNARIVNGTVDIGACESRFGKDVPVDWYVDGTGGDDANDGLSAATAFKTLQAALTNTYLMASDTVHVATGVYDSGEIVKGTRKYRAVVPADVTLLGAGADSTLIVGAADRSVSLDEAPYGCGANAVACVYLEEGATVRGFALTDGHSNVFSGGDGTTYGGAVKASSRNAYMIDCVVTNNVASRGAGLNSGTSIRCLFNDNLVSTTGCDIMTGSSFNCKFGNLRYTSSYNIYQGGPHVNGTFTGTGYAAYGANSSSILELKNCLVQKKVSQYVRLRRCVYTGELGTGTEAVDGSVKKTVPNLFLDENGRPTRASPLLDNADASFYEDFPAAVASESGYDFTLAVRVQGLGLDIGALESSASTASVDYYVDANDGNDGNAGTAADNAFKTLAAAAEGITLYSNDVIHVAAGVYSNGTMAVGQQNYRIVVPDGVSLVGAGADVTFIEGAADEENGDAVTNGCGPAAVSCVRLGVGSVLRGFTLTKGHSPAFNGNSYAGAVDARAAETGAYIIDCAFSNNVAGRAAGCYRGTSVRCRFSDNLVSQTGCDIMQGRAYNCIFGDMKPSGGTVCSVYQVGPYVNCTFYGANGSAAHTSSGTADYIRNSVVLKSYPGRNVLLKNCATSYNNANFYDADSLCLTEEEMMLDENYAPRRGSPLIDRGNAEYYEPLPDDVMAAMLKTDFAGKQRVYNGKIDIGAFEYDWRDDFARALGSSHVAVVSADEAVVTNSTGGVTVPAGASLGLVWSFSCDGRCEFNVAAVDGGTVSVLLDGVEMVPVDGIYSFVGTAGSQAAISISCEGEGYAVASAFHLCKGLVFTVR